MSAAAEQTEGEQVEQACGAVDMEAVARVTDGHPEGVLPRVSFARRVEERAVGVDRHRSVLWCGRGVRQPGRVGIVGVQVAEHTARDQGVLGGPVIERGGFVRKEFLEEAGFLGGLGLRGCAGFGSRRVRAVAGRIAVAGCVGRGVLVRLLVLGGLVSCLRFLDLLSLSFLYRLTRLLGFLYRLTRLLGLIRSGGLALECRRTRVDGLGLRVRRCRRTHRRRT